MIGIDPIYLIVVAKALKSNGFDYLQCQGGYDEGPGQNLVCFYHLIAMDELALNESYTDKSTRETLCKIIFLIESLLIKSELYIQ